MKSILISISILLFFSGCKKNGVGFIEETKLHYPSQLNNEWEYSSDFSIGIFDTLGNIDSTQIINYPNTIVKIVGANDSVGSYIGLTRFESFDLTTPQSIHTMWYLNSDSSLAAIAYKNAGYSQIVYPKISKIKNYKILDEDFLFSLLPGDIHSSPKGTVSDTVLFYNPERIVIKYPVKIGNEWVELISPFYRKRFINKKENVQTNLGNISCYKIESEMEAIKLKLIDYFSVEYGLVKREIIDDSARIATVEDPMGIGWANIRSTSVLVRANIKY